MATEAQCPTCGESNAGDAAFCLFCGTYLGWDTRQASDTAAPEQPVTAPAPGPAPVTTSAPGSPTIPSSTAADRVAPGVTSQPTPEPATARTPPEPGCAACGRHNDPGRRFCAHCGHVLIAAPTLQPAPPRAAASRSSWFGSSEERAARRAYRRSLPPLYRWRRVVIGVLVPVLVVLGIQVSGGDPVTWVKQRWYDLRGTTVEVRGVEFKDALTGAAVAAFVDGDPLTVWSRTWRVDVAAPDSCEAAEALGAVRIHLTQPARVRELRVRAGLHPDDTRRSREFRPETLFVSWPAGDRTRSCVPVTLDDTAELQTRDLDTGDPVRNLMVSVASVYVPRNETDSRTDGPVSLRSLEVRSRP